MSLLFCSPFRCLSLVVICGCLLACDAFDDLPQIDLSERLSDAQVRQLMPGRMDNNAYVFSFELRSSPIEDTRQYLPLLNYLRKATGYHFEIHIMADMDRLNTEVSRGEIDFLALGGLRYIDLAKKNKLIPLVRGINIKGRSRYRSVIVVAFNSPVQRISQLAGKRFAFGDIYSTQGHLIPRYMLREQDILLSDLAAYAYTGSHLKCAESVISGKFDACGMQDTLAQSLAEQGLLRILATSKSYPSSGIAASDRVPEEVREAVRRALIEFDPRQVDKEGLYHWEKTEMPLGFVKASDSDYDRLKQMAEQLKLFPLQTKVTSAGALEPSE